MSSIFATVQEGAGEAGQGSEEELVARVRYIRSLRKVATIVQLNGHVGN